MREEALKCFVMMGKLGLHTYPHTNINNHYFHEQIFLKNMLVATYVSLSLATVFSVNLLLILVYRVVQQIIIQDTK